MTIVYSQNFDSLTVPALPSGWTSVSGTWVSTGTNSVSSPNVLVNSPAADGAAILEKSYSPLVDMEIRYDVNVQDGFVSPILRMDSGYQNGYLINAFDATLNIFYLYKRIGGSYSQLVTLGGLSGGTPAPGTKVSVRARVQGSQISFRIWLFGTTEPSAWNGQYSDSSVATAGYPGFYNNDPSTGLSTVDNFTLDDLLTAGTSSSSDITSTTVTVANTGTSGGAPAYIYQWYRSTTPGFTPGSSNLVTGATGLTLNDAGLSPATTYFYVLETTDSQSATVFSTQISILTTSNSFTNGTLNASIVSSTTATLVDAGATNGISPYSYQWYRSTTSGFAPGVGNLISGATSATLDDTGLSPSTTYYYKNVVTDHVGATATSPQLQITTNTGSTTIIVTDSALFWSPGNWDHLTSGTFGVLTDTMQSTAPGAYLKFGVFGTANLSISIDNTTNGGFPFGDMPTVRYSIDGALFIDVQLEPSQTSLVLSNELTAGVHSVEVYFKASSTSGAFGDAWGTDGVSPTNVLRISGITFDTGGSVIAPSLLLKRMMIFGDSITAGEHVNSDGSDDATQSFAPIMARALNAEFAQIGYGGQGWEEEGSSNVPAFKTAYANYSAGRARSFSGLDYIVVVHGTNDARAAVPGATIATDLQTWLAAMRTACGSSTKLFVVVPPSASYASNLAAGISAYTATSGDTKAHLIDATALLPSGVFTLTFGAATQWTYDGVHPLAFAHGRMGGCYAAMAADDLSATAQTPATYPRSRIVNE